MEQTEKALIKKGENICDVIEQLIDTENTFSIGKIIYYCKYLLSLDKDEVNGISRGFYEECEDYLEELERYLNNRLEMKQIENDFINSYETTLAKEGEKLCKEIENNIKVCGELLVNKASVYCQFIVSKLDSLDPKLVERCNNYIENINNFNRYKSTFDKVNIDRKERKSWLDMRNMRLKVI